jgi:pSer/pThr/pTyr-binding forkhead associated (FHA) protein
LVVVVPPGLILPKDKNITISVIAGPSKGLAVQMVKPHLSIGRSGGGADIEIDDPQVSDLHCAVGVKNEMIRMCDLDSQGGTYIEDERVDVADLAHLSEFRVGSSLLLVTILPVDDVSLTLPV